MLESSPMDAEELNQVTCKDCTTIYSALLGIEHLRQKWIVDGPLYGLRIRLSNLNVATGGHIAVDNDFLNKAGDVIKRKSVGLLCHVLAHMK